MQSVTHYFVCRSPFHCFIANKIVEGFISPAEKVVIFVESANIPNIMRSSGEIEIIQLEGYSGSRGGWCQASNNIGKIIKKIQQCSGGVALYLTDIRWPTNNKLYFELRSLPRLKICYFAEGLASYINRSDRFSLAFKSMAKYALSIFHLSAPYRPFWGDNLGYERKDVDCLYAPCVDRINTRLRKIEVLVESEINKAPLHNALLFLGQPLEQKIKTEGELSSIVMSTIEKIKKMSYNELYYKPHQFEGPLARTIFESNGFTVIDDVGMFEEWVSKEWNGQAVASYFSTALITTRMLLSKKSHIYSINFDRVAAAYMKTKDRDELKRSLEYFGCVFV
ncbi:polysialyltransferase family glycosyltransferase [Pseudomonas juntendi]|uniref:polysialyltransferase family glycosyltransferase n=1 Tax=Pseudomonas TaxID=286 RepID=UPI0034D7B7F6